MRQGSRRNEASFLKRPFTRLPRLLLSKPPQQGHHSRSAFCQLRNFDIYTHFRALQAFVENAHACDPPPHNPEAAIQQFLAYLFPVRSVAKPSESTQPRDSLPVACRISLPVVRSLPFGLVISHYRRIIVPGSLRLVHVAIAPRRAEQEADPRFSRPAALGLVNQKVASHLGIEAGAPEVKSQTLSQRTPTEEERRSEFSLEVFLGSVASLTYESFDSGLPFRR
jgi:hypothetical protein